MASRPQEIRASLPVVLCIDDDPATLDVTKRLLEKCGFSVLTADDWQQGIDIFSQTHVDLVVVDYDMPGLKGHEVAVKLKSLEPKIPVVLHSGSQDLPETVTKTTDAFVPKGTDFRLLQAVISQLIQERRTEGHL